MLLLEVMNADQFDEWLIKNLSRMTASQYNASPNDNAVVQAALRKYPDLRYEGPMFRSVKLSGQEFVRANSNSDVLKMVRNHKHGMGRGVLSWSKNVEGVTDFTPQNDQERETPFDPSQLDVAVVLQQRGNGLDCHAAYLKFKDYPSVQEDYMVNSHLRQAAAVREVIGPIDQTVRIGSYSIEGVGESWDDYDEDSGEEIKAYEARPVDFRADRFEDAKKAVIRAMQGKKSSQRQKLPHRQSQYHNFAKRNREDVQYDWDKADRNREVDQPVEQPQQRQRIQPIRPR